MKVHKTFSGMVKATERTIEQLNRVPLDNLTPQGELEYREADRRVKLLLAELRGLWTNPADVATCDGLRVRLLDAWDNATK